MAFRQDQKNSQKQKVSLSPQLIEAVHTNEKSNLEIQDKIDLEKLTDTVLEDTPLKSGDEKKEEGDDEGDDEGTPDVDEDGRVNEDIEWDKLFTER